MKQGDLDPKIGEAIVQAASEVAHGKLLDHFPASGMANWERHTKQHECERGDRQPSHRDTGRETGF